MYYIALANMVGAGGGGGLMDTKVCQHGTPVLTCLFRRTIIQILINLIFRNMIQKLSIFLGNSIEKDTLNVKLPPMSLHNPRLDA